MDLSPRIARLEHELEEAERLLLSVDGSRLFRTLRLPGRLWRDWRGRLGQALLHSPAHPLYLKFRRPAAEDDAYARWTRQRREPPPACPGGPPISVLMPVRNPGRPWLEAAVESVRAQAYPGWELCVCDDASESAWVEEYFSALADPRVRFVRTAAKLGIAGAINRAGMLASGEYVAFMDQDDVLAPDALAWVCLELRRSRPDLLYTDEDRLDGAGRPVEPIFKPDWSPELLLSCMYMGHLLVARREAVQRAGWMRGEFDGAQDYDLALRITEQGGAVAHLPRVLYHWRKHPGSTAAAAGAKPYTQRAGRAALAAAAARRGLAAAVEDGPFPNTYRLRRRAAGSRASIVICSRRASLLRRCLRGIERRTAYQNREIVVVEHLAGQPEMQTAGGIWVPYTGPFDFATMNNLGAARASGEVLVFLNDDVVPLDPAWLEALVAQAERPGVGAAGAYLVYANGAIQHAGMVTGIGHGAGHPQRDTFGAGYWPWWGLARDVSAVTGACLAMRKEVFEQLRGFDSVFPVNFNDADLCLRARAAGYRVVFEPSALLRHDECKTRRPAVRFAECALWRRRWGEPGDPYYNPNLSRDEAAGLA